MIFKKSCINPHCQIFFNLMLFHIRFGPTLRAGGTAAQIYENITCTYTTTSNTTNTSTTTTRLLYNLLHRSLARPPTTHQKCTIYPHCQTSALYCWILEILYCNPKGRRAYLRVPSTEGRGVRLCWAKSKPKRT